jgi:hypothetical protein
MAKIEQVEAETVYTMEEMRLLGHQSQQAPKTAQEQTLEDIISTLNDQTDNASLTVYRQLGGGKDSMSLVQSWPVDHFKSSEDMLLWLRDNYGGGSYRAQVRVKGKIVANKLMHVEAAISKAVAVAGTGAQTGVEGILAAIMASQEKMLERIFNAKPAVNDEEMETKFLQKMLLYKNLFGGNQSAMAGGIGQLKEAVDVLQTLGVSIGGNNEDKEEGFGSILANAMPLLTAAITANSQQVQPIQQPAPQRQPVQQPTRDPAMNAAELQFKMGINLLLAAAKSGKEPATYARLIDDQYGAQALELANNPDSLHRMAAYVPEVANYPEWFADLCEHVKAINGAPSKFDAEYSDSDIEGDESDATLSTNGDQ